MKGTRIKKLDWYEGPAGHHTMYADSIVGQWAAWEIQGHAYFRSPTDRAGNLCGVFQSDAMEAAQEAYDSLIISALE